MILDIDGTMPDSEKANQSALKDTMRKLKKREGGTFGTGPALRRSPDPDTIGADYYFDSPQDIRHAPGAEK